MGSRSVLAAATAVAAALACAAPARAVETGVNETLGQTLSTAQTAARLRADWVRLWVSWEQLQPARGTYQQNVLDDFRAAVAALEVRGINVLVVVQRSPAWASRGRGGMAPPDDLAAFGAFMGG